MDHLSQSAADAFELDSKLRVVEVRAGVHKDVLAADLHGLDGIRVAIPQIIAAAHVYDRVVGRVLEEAQ